MRRYYPYRGMLSARCVKCLNRMRNVFSGAARMCLWALSIVLCACEFDMRNEHDHNSFITLMSQMASHRNRIARDGQIVTQV